MRKQSNTQKELKGNITVLDLNQLTRLKGGTNSDASATSRPDIIVVDDLLI